MTHKGHHGTHRALEAFPVSSEPRLVSWAALATVFGLVSGFGATSFSIVFPGRFYPGRNIRFRGPHLGFDMPPLFPRPWHGLI